MIVPLLTQQEFHRISLREQHSYQQAGGTKKRDTRSVGVPPLERKLGHILGERDPGAVELAPHLRVVCEVIPDDIIDHDVIESVRLAQNLQGTAKVCKISDTSDKGGSCILAEELQSV